MDDRCCERVRDSGRWPSFHQCKQKAVCGPSGRYCKLHNPTPETMGYVYIVDADMCDDEPKLHRAEVVGRTENRITLKDAGTMFHCSRFVQPGQYADSPEDAMERWKTQLAKRRANAEKEIAKVDDLAKKAIKPAKDRTR